MNIFWYVLKITSHYVPIFHPGANGYLPPVRSKENDFSKSLFFLQHKIVFLTAFSKSIFQPICLYCKILVQKVLYISLFIPVSAFLKTFYSCHRVPGVLISIVHFLLPGCTLGFGFCMHMLIMTSAFHSMHQHTISAFSILAIFLAPPKP